MNQDSVMFPGDVFEWVYISNNRQIRQVEKLYSHVMYKRVQITGRLLLVQIDNENYSWLREGRIYQARLKDGTDYEFDKMIRRVVFRVNQK